MTSMAAKKKVRSVKKEEPSQTSTSNAASTDTVDYWINQGKKAVEDIKKKKQELYESASSTWSSW
jgi:hypothetical protein